MGISFGVIAEMPPWCLMYECCKIKQSASFLIFLRILPHPRHLRDLAGSLYYGVQWNIKLFLCTSYFTIIFAARSQFHLTVIFMIIIHGQEMTFANPVPQDHGVTGRQLIFYSNIWNCVDTSLREAETLSSFKCGLSKAIL